MENPIDNDNNLISFKDTDEERVMHSKSDNMEIMINKKADEKIENYFFLDTKLNWKKQ